MKGPFQFTERSLAACIAYCHRQHNIFAKHFEGFQDAIILSCTTWN